jgi:hypothetical protein
MWDEQKQPDGDLNGTVIIPTTVLYEYDGPLIFRAKLGLVDALFLKVSGSEGSLFLACSTTDEVVSMLQSGRLSVYGAFDAETYWLIRADALMRAASYWRCARIDIPGKFLPKRRLGLYHWLGEASDSIAQATSLLAVRFQGADMTRAGMPFGTFRALTERFYELARKALTPPTLLNTRTTTFDYEISEPIFSSLVMAIRDPVFNGQAMSRIPRLRGVKQSDLKLLIDENQRAFAGNVQALTQQSKLPALDREYAQSQFAFLDIISGVLPTEDSDVSSVEITANVNGQVTTAHFDRRSAHGVHAALKLAMLTPVTDVGVITGLSTKAASLIVTSRRGKDVTCYFDREEYDTQIRSRSFAPGVQLTMTGILERRPRRDRMVVDRYSILPNPFA